MTPVGDDAPEARTQGDDAQERANQSGDAGKASESQETPAEASPSGNERRVRFAGNNDDKEGDNGEKHVDADGDEVMEGSTVDTEAKESDDRLNADPNGSSSLNIVSATLNAGDKASDEHSFLAPGWHERRLVSNAEYAGLSTSKLVPASSFNFADESVQRPVCWLVSPPIASDMPLRVVGVPASADAVHNGARFHDGYGGLEVLQTLETLTDEDYKDLESVIGPNFASVLSVLRAERLAERTFNTVSFLKRLLNKYRQLKLAIESNGQTSAQHTVDLLDVNEGLRREWAVMEVYWKEEVERITAAKQDGESAFKQNFIRQQEDHQHALNARADEIAELKDQLQTSEALCEVLCREIREKTLGAWAFSDFLDREPQVTVAGNWKRLQELFGHFADGTTPPAGGITNIHVVAIDQPQCVCGDYATERKKANGGDSASKLVPPLKKTVDLTGGNAGSSKSKSKQSASKGKSASKGCRKKLSWDEFLKKRQLRPSNYRPSPQLALPASSKLARSEDEAREVLPGPHLLSSSSSGDSEYEQEDDVEPDDSDVAPKVPETVVPAKQSSLAAKRKLDMLESGAANQKEGSLLRRSPRNQSKAKPTQSGSAVKKARLAAKVIEQLMESPRKATALARISFKRLTLEQLSKKSKPQTIGFPNYAPQKGKMIQKKLPWNVMFAERTKVLYCHDASKLSADTMRGLKKHIRRYKTHLKKLVKIKDFPETLFQEPGIWPLPQRICNWIWEDSRVVDSDGEPKPLRQQLVELDEREPARTLWATAANEVERTKYVSADLRANHSIPLPQRARNWIVPDRLDNEPEEEDDEDDDEMSEFDDDDEEDEEEEDVEEEDVEEEEVEEG
ncbi:hypothetical protein PHYSODRAFT_341324 [Phytophthora sojae]|uniref:Uncharacterized protein n=1 Tax=Phytophthora sojae (strain P6497) TaxID=1094619 RepID=G5ACS9_PHYSP|nr:hypothetical protein PHYSODRAFT_341324 [Phytophthora sojae]EGZ07153.1 hypothetical protein PHYSODRAFT_341324 [Phytophthora sojae]|eukprot:XP_009537917.1 hypothetical protein PHYSODRAFT_341324 [Phytophthora sojae]